MASEKQEEQLAEGTLMSHLLELRDRLLKAVLALFVAFIPCAVFANELFAFIRASKMCWYTRCRAASVSGSA